MQLCNAHCLRLIPVKVAVVDKILFSGALSSTIRLHYTTASKHNSFKNNQQKRVDCLNLVCHTNKNLLNFFAELGCPLPGHWPASRSTDIVEELERVCMFLILSHWDIEVILERISLLEIELSSLTYYLMQIVPTISFSNDAIERMKIWKSDIFKSHSEVSDLDKMETDEWWLDKARQSWADWFFVEEFSWINWKIQWPHHPYQYW